MKIDTYSCSAVLEGKGHRPDHCNRFGRLLGLTPYKNKGESCLFFGCYNKIDYAKIMKHTSNTIVYWGGTDIIKAGKNKWSFRPEILHVVGNKRCQKELEQIGIKSIIRPIAEVCPDKLRLEPLGDAVFVYMPYRRRAFYGIKIVTKVASRYPRTKFLLLRWGKRRIPFRNAEAFPLVNFEDLKELYKRSFVGIRPVKHDGNPQTNIELGLMGRRTGWTYPTPFQERCGTLYDYRDFVGEEMNRKKPDQLVRQHYLDTVNNFDFLE